MADDLHAELADHFPGCQGEQGHVQPEECPGAGESEEGREPDDASSTDRDLRVPHPHRSTMHHPMFLHDATRNCKFIYLKEIVTVMSILKFVIRSKLHNYIEYNFVTFSCCFF